MNISVKLSILPFVKSDPLRTVTLTCLTSIMHVPSARSKSTTFVSHVRHPAVILQEH
jgi:hypothetical protein